MRQRTNSPTKKVDVKEEAKAILRGRLMTFYHDGRGTLRSVVPREPLEQCMDVVRRAVAFGESGSILIVGHAGSGKSTLVSVALSEVENEVLEEKENSHSGRNSQDHEDAPFKLVSLSGVTYEDDRSALQDVTRQLQLENVVGDRVFGSVSENLSFILEALRTGDRKTVPVVFLLDEAEIFCVRGKQTLLYNLLDCTQIAGTPICVVGMTNRFDLLDLMEKRVRSRFSQRIVYLFPRHAFQQFLDISKRLLTLEENAFPSSVSSRKSGELRSFVEFWSQAIDEVVSSQVFQSALKSIFQLSPNFRALKAFLLPLVSDERVFEAETSSALAEVMKSGVQRAACSTTAVAGRGTCDLADLPVLELTLLIAGRRLALLAKDAKVSRSDQSHTVANKPLNFRQLYTEYVRFARENPSVQLFDQSVVFRAFCNLVEGGFFQKACDRGGGKDDSCKEFRKYYLGWGEEELMKHVKVYPSLPTALQRWIDAPVVAGYYGQ